MEKHFLYQTSLELCVLATAQETASSLEQEISHHTWLELAYIFRQKYY